MRPMKFKKIKDECNVLGSEEIILLDRSLAKKRFVKDCPVGPKGIYQDSEVYDYEFLALCDSELLTISDEAWLDSFEAYKFIEFI